MGGDPRVGVRARLRTLRQQARCEALDVSCPGSGLRLLDALGTHTRLAVPRPVCAAECPRLLLACEQVRRDLLRHRLFLPRRPIGEGVLRRNQVAPSIAGPLRLQEEHSLRCLGDDAELLRLLKRLRTLTRSLDLLELPLGLEPSHSEKLVARGCLGPRAKAGRVRPTVGLGIDEVWARRRPAERFLPSLGRSRAELACEVRLSAADPSRGVGTERLHDHHPSQPALDTGNAERLP